MNFGTPSLVGIAEDMMETWTDEQQLAYAKNHLDTLRMLKDRKQWLMPFIAQYNSRWKPDIAETSWMSHIKQMIAEGTLYFAMYPARDWAAPDAEREHNFHTLRSAGFAIDDPCQNEDAIFRTKRSVSLSRVYLSDEETPQDVETIKLDLAGVVEIGTQSIPKTAMCLMQGIPLMRLPYKLQATFIPPVVGILHNTRPMNIE